MLQRFQIGHAANAADIGIKKVLHCQMHLSMQTPLCSGKHLRNCSKPQFAKCCNASCRDKSLSVPAQLMPHSNPCGLPFRLQRKRKISGKKQPLSTQTHIPSFPSCMRCIYCLSLHAPVCATSVRYLMFANQANNCCLLPGVSPAELLVNDQHPDGRNVQQQFRTATCAL